MIRVLHVSSVGMNARGGTEQSISLLCKYLRTRGVESFLWSPYGGGAMLDALKTESALAGYTFALDADELAMFVASNRPDLALLHSGALNPLYAQPPAVVLAEMRDLPLIEVLHRAFRSWAEPYRVDRIVAVSRHVASMQGSGNADHVRAIHNGLEQGQFAPSAHDKAKTREAFGLPRSGLAVGFLGRMAEEKGPQDLIGVASTVSRSVPNAYFVFAGDGPLLPHLRQRAAANHFSNVRFLGYLPPDQRSAFFATLDLLVLPSHAEAFSLVAVEAMAAALPIVGYATGGIPEILSTADTSDASEVLVSPGDVAGLSAAVTKLLGSEETRARIASANRRAADRFSIERTAGAYRALFEEVIKPGTIQYSQSATPAMHRYCGHMALLTNNRNQAELCFQKAMAFDPRLDEAIRMDIARFAEFAQRLQNSTRA